MEIWSILNECRSLVRALTMPISLQSSVDADDYSEETGERERRVLISERWSGQMPAVLQLMHVFWLMPGTLVSSQSLKLDRIWRCFARIRQRHHLISHLDSCFHSTFPSAITNHIWQGFRKANIEKMVLVHLRSDDQS